MPTPTTASTNITIGSGPWDTGAWHRAVMVAKTMYQEGLWDGEAVLTLHDPYMLYQRLYGIEHAPTSALIEGTDYEILRKESPMSLSPAAGPFARTHAAPVGAPTGAPASVPSAKAGPPPSAGESNASPAPLVVKVTTLPSIDHTGMIQSARDAASDLAALRDENARLRHALAAARRGRMVYRLAYRQMRDERAKAGRSLETQLYLSRTYSAEVQTLKRELVQAKGERDEISLGLATVRAALSTAGYAQGNLVDRIARMGSDLEAARARSVTPPSPQPNDELTLAYLRQWWQRLPAEQRTADALTAVLDDLARPWHKRGTAWIGVVRACEGAIIGQTPAQMSRVNSSEKATVKLGG